jgi:hypothetical protein
MQRRKLQWALAGLAVVVTSGAAVLWPRTEQITRQNFDRIHTGMTRTEVEAILGRPGDYSTAPIEVEYRGDSVRVPDRWVSDQAVIAISFFDAHDQAKGTQRVAYSLFNRAKPIEQTSFENLVWRAKRQWHHWFL